MYVRNMVYVCKGVSKCFDQHGFSIELPEWSSDRSGTADTANFLAASTS